VHESRSRSLRTLRRQTAIYTARVQVSGGAQEEGRSSTGKVTGRKLMEVITPSTLHLSPGWTEPMARHLLMLTGGVLTTRVLFERCVCCVVPDVSTRDWMCAEGEAGQLGVCFVDLSFGRFHIGEMTADTARTQLALLLAYVDPVELVYARLPAHGHALDDATRAALQVPPPLQWLHELGAQPTKTCRRDRCNVTRACACEQNTFTA